MTTPIENQPILPVRQLSANQSYEITLTLSDEDSRRIAADLDLTALRKARLKGTLAPFGQNDWEFKGEIGATVVQPCVVTLAPVTTRLDEPVLRRFLAELPEMAGSEEEEIEMPEDDSVDALGHEISLLDIFSEALSLALPAYPRAEGADLGEAVFAADGVTPLRDEDAKPFAGLAALKAKMEDGGE